MADSSPLLTVPIEVWDRILFWMSLSPLDVANFAKASTHCHFLAFGPVGDRNEYNVLQHGALIGPRVVEKEVEYSADYFKYIGMDLDFPIDYVLLAFLRMADRQQAVCCFEQALDGGEDDQRFEGDSLIYCLENTKLEPRTKKLLRQLAERFRPSDFQGKGRKLIHVFGAFSGVTYCDKPSRKWVSAALRCAMVGNQPETAKWLLASGMYVNTTYPISIAFKYDNYECFEVGMDWLCSKSPRRMQTYDLFERFYHRVGSQATHRYNMRLFQEVANGTLPLPDNPSDLDRVGICARKLIVSDEKPAELMALILSSRRTSLLLEAVTKHSRYEQECSESLKVLELAIDAGYAKFDFGRLSKLFDSATRWGQTSILPKLIFQVELDFGTSLSKRKKTWLQYAKWFGDRILIPLCEDHDWTALRREVEDLAEDSGFGMEMLSVCYQEVSRQVSTNRDICGTDCGLTAVRQIVAAFTPWLFNGE